MMNNPYALDCFHSGLWLTHMLSAMADDIPLTNCDVAPTKHNAHSIVQYLLIAKHKLKLLLRRAKSIMTVF